MSEKRINATFAKNLNYYLYINDKSQLDLAQHLNVSAATASNWCKGIKMPRMDKIDRICDFFNITPSDLIEEKQETDHPSSLNPDIRMITRAGKKMTDEQLETLRKYAEFMFPDAFKE